jgi:hypothetical protein
MDVVSEDMPGVVSGSVVSSQWPESYVNGRSTF